MHRKFARLSVAVGVLSTIAAVVFTAAFEIIVPPEAPYRTGFLGFGLFQLSFFSLIAGAGPAAFAWIHPASRRLARHGLRWSLMPIIAGALAVGIASWIVRSS